MLNSYRYSVPSPIVTSVVQASYFQPLSMLHIPSTPIPSHVVMTKLSALMNATSIVPPAVNWNISGMAFRQLATRRNPNASAYDNSTLGNNSVMLSMVNCNPINGYVYDAIGNRISWLINQLFGTIIHMVCHILITVFKFIKTSTTVRIGAVI